MDLVKKSLTALILLFIVCLAWAGLSIYYESNDLDVNPNASSYTKQLRGQFDLEELGKITERTKDNFPVSPEEFTSIIEKN